MDIEVLDRLRRAGGQFVPIGELGAEPAAVLAALKEMEEFGFALERHPYRGVAYRGPAAKLCPDQIEWRLGTVCIGRRVAVWNRVASTNDLAARAAGSLANEGLVILAEEQTAGRGRRGRSWSAPASRSILMSVLLFPEPDLADHGWLTALGAVAVAEVVEEAIGRASRIKWPNDVRVAGRKVAGVLVERGPGAGAVVGIGLNVNLDPADLPADVQARATSIREWLGAPADRSELARALIQRLDRAYEEGRRHGPGPLNDRWRARLEPLGRPVRVETRAGPVVGRLIEADLRLGLTIGQAEGNRRLTNAEVLAVEDDGGPAVMA